MTNLTVKQIRELREAFDYYDEDGSGSISHKELKKMLRSTDTNISDREIDELISHIDRNHDGCIQFEEFLRAMAPTYQDNYTDRDIYAAFCDFDENGDGKLSIEELYDALKSLGINYSKKKILKELKKIDKDGDDEISFSEFKYFIKS